MFRWTFLFVLAIAGLTTELRAEATPKLDATPTLEETVTAPELFDIEKLLLAATNAERVRYGRQPLEIDMKLVSTSRRHSAWMASSQVMQHGRYPVAENIATGQASVAEALRSWMNSSGHRANILNPNYRRLGVAGYVSNNGRIYWTQQFTN